MEEYRPLAADGAAPDGQTRLPWGDEAPVVTVETPSPVAVEAHPPEPITHFATPEATFFTAEPPPPAPAEGTEEHEEQDEDAAEASDAEQPELDLDAAIAFDDDQPDDDQPDDEVPDQVADQADDAWSEEAVDDVWSD